MGWAKYGEDNVSRFWRDAKTHVRMGTGKTSPPAEGGVSNDQLSKLRRLCAQLTKDPHDQGIKAQIRAEMTYLTKIGLSQESINVVMHGVTAPGQSNPNEGNMFDPKKFTVAKARPIPVYLLLDTSTSMTGDKIETLNSAVAEMLQAFGKEEQIETIIEVCIITFGGDEAHLLFGPTKASAIDWSPLKTEGMTPLGSAISMAKKMIEDKTITPSNAYRPTVVLISDGEPNDKWKEPMVQFIEAGRSSKCDRMAMAIGSRADANVLNQFIKGTQHSLFTARDAGQLHTFFQRLTMTVGARTRSTNPNDVPDASLFKVDDRVSKPLGHLDSVAPVTPAVTTNTDQVSDPW